MRKFFICNETTFTRHLSSHSTFLTISDIIRIRHFGAIHILFVWKCFTCMIPVLLREIVKLEKCLILMISKVLRDWMTRKMSYKWYFETHKNLYQEKCLIFEFPYIIYRTVKDIGHFAFVLLAPETATTHCKNKKTAFEKNNLLMPLWRSINDCLIDRQRKAN